MDLYLAPYTGTTLVPQRLVNCSGLPQVPYILQHAQKCLVLSTQCFPMSVLTFVVRVASAA